MAAVTSPRDGRAAAEISLTNSASARATASTLPALTVALLRTVALLAFTVALLDFTVVLLAFTVALLSFTVLLLAFTVVPLPLIGSGLLVSYRKDLVLG